MPSPRQDIDVMPLGRPDSDLCDGAFAESLKLVLRSISDMHAELRELRNEARLVKTPEVPNIKTHSGIGSRSIVSKDVKVHSPSTDVHSPSKTSEVSEEPNSPKASTNLSVDVELLRKRSWGVIHTIPRPNLCLDIVETTLFKVTVALFIVGNCLFVGVEVDTDMHHALDYESHSSLALDWGNHIFASFFTLELLVRLMAYRLNFFSGDDWIWNIFDCLIVLSALGEYVFSGINGVSALRSLRAFRLVRTLRVLRVIRLFRTLQLLVHGIFQSLTSLLWTLAFLTLLLYLVTIIVVSGSAGYLMEDHQNRSSSAAPNDGSTLVVLSDDMTPDEMHRALRWHFCSVPRGMLSLFMAVTGGVDYFQFLQPLLNISYIYAFIFIGFVVIIVFGVFNALNACFVEGVIHNRDKDLLIYAEQARTLQFVKDLAELFKEGSSEKQRTLSIQELNEHCSNPRVSAYLAIHSLNTSDVETLFYFLDANGDGQIDVEEFVLGVLKLKGPARCLDLLKMQDAIHELRSEVNSISALVAIDGVV